MKIVERSEAVTLKYCSRNGISLPGPIPISKNIATYKDKSAQYLDDLSTVITIHHLDVFINTLLRIEINHVFFHIGFPVWLDIQSYQTSWNRMDGYCFDFAPPIV